MDFQYITALTVADMDTLKMVAENALKNFEQSFDHFISLKSEPTAAFDYLQLHHKSNAENLHTSLNTTMLMQNYNQSFFTGTAAANLYAVMLP